MTDPRSNRSPTQPESSAGQNSGLTSGLTPSTPGMTTRRKGLFCNDFWWFSLTPTQKYVF